MSVEKVEFQAEVSKILDIVIHALYSNKEIFLREIISNASDACHRLRYDVLTQPNLLGGESADYSIFLTVDQKANTLAIKDNGIGMSREDLIEKLGSLGRSGTGEFLNKLTGDQKKDASMIGQFGVGFYSGFMVADKMEVRSKRGDHPTGYLWSSDGKGSFEIQEIENLPRGTEILLFLKQEEKEYSDAVRVRHIVKKYSNHISFPIYLDIVADPSVKNEASQEKDLEDSAEESVSSSEKINEGSSVWLKPKSEITEQEYKDFYKTIAHAYDDPWKTIHYHAEGAFEYHALLYIPSMRPFDLFNPERKHSLQLYINRVYITDDCQVLLPKWLRFVKGIVDSADLPLNVSREMLQHNPLLHKMQNGLVKKILSDLKAASKKDEEDYLKFWDQFGAALKEGLYEEKERSQDLIELCRFYSLNKDKYITITEYLEDLKEGQENIYYILGENRELLKLSPQVEGFKARGIDVLLLTDQIDEFWVASVPHYKEKKIKDVFESSKDLDTMVSSDTDKDEVLSKDQDYVEKLIASIKDILKSDVKDVRVTSKLVDSPVCLSSDEGDLSMQMERILKKSYGDNETPRVLEINPKHDLILKMARAIENNTSQEEQLSDTVYILFEQARVVAGLKLKDPGSFGKRLARSMSYGW